VPDPYVLRIEPAAQRDLRRLGEKTLKRILDQCGRLERDPRHPGAQKLSGYDMQWRVRVGDYRILYEIRDRAREIRVFRVAHRREAYR
jgi:mRNA interferase RelE/StbE